MSILSGKYRIKQKYLYLWVRVKIYFVDEWPDFNFDVDIVFRHI